MMYPGMKARIQKELLEMRPFQSPFQVCYQIEQCGGLSMTSEYVLGYNVSQVRMTCPAVETVGRQKRSLHCTVKESCWGVGLEQGDLGLHLHSARKFIG